MRLHQRDKFCERAWHHEPSSRRLRGRHQQGEQGLPRDHARIGKNHHQKAQSRHRRIELQEPATARPFEGHGIVLGTFRKRGRRKNQVVYGEKQNQFFAA